MARYLLWLLLVVSGMLGWGSAVLRVFRFDRNSSTSAPQLLIGVAMMSGIAAIASIMGFGSPLTWCVSLGVGSGLWLVTSFHVLRSTGMSATKSSVRKWSVSLLALMLGVGLSLTNAVMRPWNPCDDDPAYLYLARRFWKIGDLAEPFNNRRLTSPGLFSFLQAVVTGPFGEGSLHVADEFLGSLLLLFVFWRRKRDSEMYLPGLVLVAAVVISHQYFGAANSSPTLFIFAVLVASLPDLSTVQRSPRQSMQEGVIFGAGSAVVVLCRPYMILVVAVLLIAIVVGYRAILSRHFMASVILSGLLLAVPWALMGLDDVGTPLFPLMKGNLAPNFPFDGYLDKVGIWTSLFGSVQGLTRSVWPMAVLFVVFGHVLLRRQIPEYKLYGARNDVYFILTTASLLVAFYMFFAVSVRRTGPAEWFPRFWAPALALPVVFLLMKDRTSTTAERPSGALLALLAPLLLFYPTVNGAWSTVSTMVRVGVSGDATSTLTKNRYILSEPDYQAISSRIPTGARVLFAVQLPHLLLSSHYHGVSLDLAGSTVRSSPFPFFSSFEEKRAWLVQNNFDYVVVTHGDSTSCLYGLPSWNSNVGKNNTYEDWMKYVVDWIQFADSLTANTSDVMLSANDLSLIRV